jgi:ketosteroid isomerase-like protein
MDHLGHSDPKLALRIYAKVVARHRHGQRLEGVLRGVRWARMGTNLPVAGGPGFSRRPPSTRKPRASGAFARWAVLGSNQRPPACQAVKTDSDSASQRQRFNRLRDTLARLSSDGGGAVAQEHDLPLDEYHRAGHALTNGNPEAYKPLYSHRDDVTVANPFGPPIRGWSEVSATLDRAAQNYRDGEVVGFENVSTVMGSDLAYTVEIERYRARVGGAREMAPVALRVTSIFRREDGVWKVVHRHGDPITAPRPAESVVQT